MGTLESSPEQYTRLGRGPELALQADRDMIYL